jgi:membrane fusion protein (multidrug efflux system)
MRGIRLTYDWDTLPGWLWRTGAFVLALAVLLLITTRWSRWRSDANEQSTEDAYLQSDLTPIAAKVSGYVRSMPVQDFEHVHAGQLLAEIVQDDYQAAVAQLTAAVAAAAAQIHVAEAQMLLQEANVRGAKATIAATRANLDQNTRDLARQPANRLDQSWLYSNRRAARWGHRARWVTRMAHTVGRCTMQNVAT